MSNYDEMKKRLESELIKLKGKLEETKVQAELGAMDMREKLKPEIDRAEVEFDKAKKKLAKFGETSEGAWDEIEDGVKMSLDILKESIETAKSKFK